MSLPSLMVNEKFYCIWAIVGIYVYININVDWQLVQINCTYAAAQYEIVLKIDILSRVKCISVFWALRGWICQILGTYMSYLFPYVEFSARSTYLGLG